MMTGLNSRMLLYFLSNLTSLSGVSDVASNAGHSSQYNIEGGWEFWAGRVWGGGGSWGKGKFECGEKQFLTMIHSNCNSL